MHSPNVARIRLRSVCRDDVETIFQWRNDPWIVALSGSGRTVTRAEHETWFANVLDQQQHLFFIIETNTHDEIGSVRVDRTDQHSAVVSIYLLEAYIGHGRGPAALREGTHLAFRAWPELAEIKAFIRPENARSVRAFANAGFARHNQPVERSTNIEMRLPRPPEI